MADRSQALAYAAQHGTAAAAARYGVRPATIRQWRRRQHQRDQQRDSVTSAARRHVVSAGVRVGRQNGQDPAAVPAQAPAGPLPPWQPGCHRCGDVGWVPTRGGRITCPDCGDAQRRPVLQLDRDAWVAALARAADATDADQRPGQLAAPAAGRYSPARELAAQAAAQRLAKQTREAERRRREREAHHERR
jgi:hypothetical protein